MFVEKLAATVVALLVLFSPEALAVSSEGEQGPAPIVVPDIRANIIKMLQQNAAEEDLFDLAEKQQEKTQPSPLKQADEPAQQVKKPETPPAKPTGPPVELPVKEFVIEDMDDLKRLAEELQKAKKRQAGQ